MQPAALVDLFGSIASAIRVGLDGLSDWGSADGHPGQYQHDVLADFIAVPMLTDAGLGVLSEESPPVGANNGIVAVIDPIDGSTNAAMGLPWFATSICAVDEHGPLAALVVNQATGVTYTAIRDEGAWRDGASIAPSPCTSLTDAIVILNDLPASHLGWRQYRVLGAAALDLCAVADGTADAYADLGVGLHPWDYLGAVLVCEEAGAAVGSIGTADVHDASPSARANVVAGATSALCDSFTAALTS